MTSVIIHVRYPTNLKDTSISAGKTFLKALYDAQRLYEDLVPV